MVNRVSDNGVLLGNRVPFLSIFGFFYWIKWVNGVFPEEKFAGDVILIFQLSFGENIMVSPLPRKNRNEKELMHYSPFVYT